MMKNKLEKFVNQHRDDFDAELPARDLWLGINTAPSAKSKLIGFLTRTRVAAILLVMVNAVVIVLLFSHKKDTVAPVATASQTQQQEPAEGMPAEETLDQISRSVEIKQAALLEIRSSNPVLYRKFTEAFTQLSTMYRSLEKELNQTDNKEELLEAMIQNLSLQQELLNQQLAIYQKVKHQKNEKPHKNI